MTTSKPQQIRVLRWPANCMP